MQPDKTDVLLDYFKSQLSNGVSVESLRSALEAAQWPANNIEEALHNTQQSSQPTLNNNQSQTASLIPTEKQFGAKK